MKIFIFKYHLLKKHLLDLFFNGSIGTKKNVLKTKNGRKWKVLGMKCQEKDTKY